MPKVSAGEYLQSGGLLPGSSHPKCSRTSTFIYCIWDARNFGPEPELGRVQMAQMCLPTSRLETGPRGVPVDGKGPLHQSSLLQQESSQNLPKINFTVNFNVEVCNISMFLRHARPRALKRASEPQQSTCASRTCGRRIASQ